MRRTSPQTYPFLRPDRRIFIEFYPITMRSFFKSFRFPAKAISHPKTVAAPMPSGVLSTAELRRLVADMVD